MLVVNLEDKELNTLFERLTAEQISDLIKQILKKYAQLSYPWPAEYFMAEIMNNLKKNKRRLSKYPPEVTKALLETLDDISSTKDREYIPEITRRINVLLQNQYGKRFKQYSGNKIGELLSLLGFSERKKGDVGWLVLVDRRLLQHHLNGIA
jgi:uncharacterized membrane-anchored protein YjiN (DUF445 family)